MTNNLHKNKYRTITAKNSFFKLFKQVLGILFFFIKVFMIRDKIGLTNLYRLKKINNIYLKKKLKNQHRFSDSIKAKQRNKNILLEKLDFFDSLKKRL